MEFQVLALTLKDRYPSAIPAGATRADLCDEDELPANGGAGSSSFHGAGSSSDPAPKRVKLEGGGSKPLPAPAAPAPVSDTGPNLRPFAATAAC